MKDAIRLQAFSRGLIQSTPIALTDRLSGQQLSFVLSHDDEVETKIREVAVENGFPDGSIDSFVNKSLVSLLIQGIIPVFAINVDFNKEHGVLRMYQGENLDDAISRFSQLKNKIQINKIN